MIGTVSFTGRQAEMYYLVGVVLDVGTRGDKETVFAAVVATQTTHHNELIIEVIGVLCISTRYGLLHKT
ncbi:hypothetical protein SDC9_166666 [bioreactor metagenome]|uniref:Uncharacterized protein n=1 Tax=bioreactor metagenome TaxID=1076179 RepID=A0A645G0A4_9ZZZZ